MYIDSTHPSFTEEEVVQMMERVLHYAGSSQIIPKEMRDTGSF
jgi:DNA/RNA endonuclease YhcR with UshA esterase domain